MKIRIIVWIPLLFIWFGCKQSGDNKKKSLDIKTEPSSMEHIAGLYEFYTENPTTQEEKEDNMILDYAVEKELSLSRTQEGVYYLMTEPGKGPKLDFGERVRVDYRTYGLDGKVYDSSIARGKPLDFEVGQMIVGLNIGLTRLQSGSKGIIIVPSRLAYGEKGNSVVPPNTVLVFEVHVIF